MPTTKHQAPTPAQVGDFYNKVNHLLAQFQGGSIHYGYWTGPDDDSSFEQASERLTDVVVGKLGVGPGDRVLDLGCGTGRPAIQMARRTGATVLGVSVSTGDVAAGTALAEAEGMSGQVTFQYGDAMDLDLPPGSFDAVLGIELLVHVPDRAKAMAQMAKVVKPGGRIVLTDFVTGPEIESEVVREGLAETLAAFASGPLAELDDFPGWAREAGIEIDEIVDITPHTSVHSYPKTLEAMLQYAEQHEEIPAELARILTALKAPEHWGVTDEEMGEELVIIVVAHRPERPTTPTEA